MIIAKHWLLNKNLLINFFKIILKYFSILNPFFKKKLKDGSTLNDIFFFD